MTHLEQLVQKIATQMEASPSAEIAVTLDDFFLGNEDQGSIGANLGDEQPPIAEFYRILRGIRARPDVQDVLVRIYGQEDGESWPYTDAVYILTSASLSEVEGWVSSLKPDEVNPDWMYGLPPAAPALTEGMSAFTVWWD
jgi:hypothetical protein